MATFSELIVRIGADIAPLSEGLNQAITALESAGTAATKSGNAISKAFSTLGVKDSAAQTAAAVKNLQKAFEQIDTAYKTGKVTAEDYTKAQAGLRAEIEKLTKVNVKGFADSFKDFDKLGSSLKNIGTSLTAAITAPLAAISVGAVKMAGDFEASMNKVSALGEITGASLQKLETLALDLGAKTKYSAKEAADGMAELAAAGMNAQQVAAAMPAVLDLAAAGELAVGQAAETAANLMGGFGIAAEDMGHAVDVIAKAAASGQQTVSQMSETFKYVAPIAKSAGLSLEDVAAATTLMAKAGIKGEQAGTAMRGMLAKLIDPSKEAAEAMKALGLNIKDSQGQLKPFGDILTELQKKASSTQAIFKIFGQESASGVQALVNAGAPALQALSKEFHNADGAARQMAETLNSGIKGAIERAKGSIETAAISIGKALGPAAQQVAGVVESLANKVADVGVWFSKLPVPIQNATIGMGAFLASLGPITYMGGTLASSLSNISKLMIELKASAAAAGSSFAGLGAVLGTVLMPAILALAGVQVASGLMDLIDVNKQFIDVLQAMREPALGAQEAIKSVGGAAPEVVREIGLMETALREWEDQMAHHAERAKGMGFWDWMNPGKIAIHELKVNLLDLLNVIKLVTGTYPEMDKAVRDSLAKQQQFARNNMRDQAEAATKVHQAQADNAKAQQRSAAEQARLLAQVSKDKDKNEKDKTSDAFKTLGIKDDSYDIKKKATEATEALKLLEQQYKAGAISANDFARAQQEAWKAINYLESAANELQGKQTIKTWMELMFPQGGEWSTKAKQYIKDLQAVTVEFEKYEGTVKGAENIKLANLFSGMPDLKALSDGFEMVGGAQENLAEQVRKTEAAYTAMAQAAQQGLATVEQADKLHIELLKQQIQLAKEIGDSAEAERKQNELAAASLEKVITLTDAYHAIGVKSLGELKAEADQLRQAYERIAEAAAQGQASQTEVLEAKKKQLEADRELAKATGQSWAEIDVALQRVQKELDRLYDLKGMDALTKAWHDFAVGVGDTINKSLTEGLHSIFESVRNLDFGDIGKSLTKVWDDLKTNLQRVALSAFVDPIEKGLDKIIMRLTDKLTDLLTKAIDKVLDKITGKAIDKGIDAGLDAIGLGTKAASGAAGTAGKAASSGAGGAMAAVGGLAGAVNMASGLVSAGAGVATAIGTFRLEGTMNQVERNTAAASIHLLNILEKLNEYLPYTKGINDAWYKYFEYFASLMTTVETAAADTKTAIDGLQNAIQSLSIAASSGTGDAGGSGGLDVVNTSINNGTTQIVSGLDRVVTAVSTSAGAPVAAIGEYQKRLNDLLQQNAWAEQDIARKLDAQKASSDDAFKQQLQVEIDQLNALKANNTAESESIKAALGALTKTAQAVATTGSQTADALKAMTQYQAELAQKQAQILSGLAPEFASQLEQGVLNANLESIDENTLAAITEYKRITEELRAVKDAIRSAMAKPTSSESPKAETADTASGAGLGEGYSSRYIQQEASGNTGVISSINTLNTLIADRFTSLFDILTNKGVVIVGGVPNGGGVVMAGTTTSAANSETQGSFTPAQQQSNTTPNPSRNPNAWGGWNGLYDVDAYNAAFSQQMEEWRLQSKQISADTWARWDAIIAERGNETNPRFGGMTLAEWFQNVRNSNISVAATGWGGTPAKDPNELLAQWDRMLAEWPDEATKRFIAEQEAAAREIQAAWDRWDSVVESRKMERLPITHALSSRSGGGMTFGDWIEQVRGESMSASQGIGSAPPPFDIAELERRWDAQAKRDQQLLDYYASLPKPEQSFGGTFDRDGNYVPPPPQYAQPASWAEADRLRNPTPYTGQYTPIEFTYPRTLTEQGHTPTTVLPTAGTTVNVNVGNIRNQNDVDYLVNQLQNAGVRI